MRGRVTGLTVVVLVFFALVLGQAVFIQIHRASGLDADPANPRNQATSILYPKGQILASNGMVLARSIPTTSSTHPWRRGYPLASLTSDIVGYSSFFYGTGGIEDQYRKYLVSHTVPARSISQVLSPEHATDTVSLTLEVALQQVAARALDGRDGAVVALDPRDGAVLAMYSNPTYNPVPLASRSDAVQRAAWLKYIKPNLHGFPPLGNVATQETFPPGSTSKVVTTAAVERYWPGLADKSYPVRSCTPLPYSDKVLCNAGGSPCGGTISVMLPASCDPGYADVGLDLGGLDLSNQANQFGYNATPPLDLGQIAGSAAVVPSFFPSAKSFLNNQPGVAYSAIGQQDVRATALQNALIAAGIANHGKVMAPHLLRVITDSQGRTVKKWSPTVWRHPLGPQEADAIVPLMQGVVTGGTASSVGFLYQDEVAAKTGTAQTGNAAQNTDDWMIAFAPASRPLVAVAVVVPYQDVSAWGATVAGPIVKCVIEGALAIDAGQKPAGTATTCPT